MSTVRPIVKGVAKPVVGNVVLPFGASSYLQFNGSDQYAEHAAWTPTGVNFSISLRYTPDSADIGSLVTILGDDVLQKDASDNLVFNYTDTAAGAQAVTLSALALVADTEYLIVVASDGNGVSVTVGSDTASNSAVIDPSTLEIESWMASAGAVLSAGVVRDIDFQDDSAIQNGTFLEGDASAVYVDVGTHTIENDSTIDIWLRKWTAFTVNKIVFGGNHAANYYLNISNNGDSLSFWINGQNINFAMAALGVPQFQSGQDYHLSFHMKDNTLTFTRNGDIIGSSPFTTLHTSPFTLYLLRSETIANYNDLSMQFKITHNSSGDTYEYLLNNVTDNGDGTGLAPNTGNTGSSFDGIVQNYDPLTDLVAIPNNTRNYPVSSDSNIQPDTLNADGPELFVPTSLDAGWTDNGDGSYSWDASSGQFIFTDSGILSSDKYYLATFEITEYAGSGSISFSGNSLVGATSMNSVGVYTAILKGGTSSFIEFFFGFGTGTGTMENVSVKETTSAEVINFDQSMVQS